MSRLLKTNLFEIDWYSYIDEEYEWLRDFVYNPAETWKMALSKGGKSMMTLRCQTGENWCLPSPVSLDEALKEHRQTFFLCFR